MISEHPIEFIEHALRIKNKMWCLEDHLDSVHCILLRVRVLPEHMVISFNLYQNRAEKGAAQTLLPVKSIQKLRQRLNI